MPAQLARPRREGECQVVLVTGEAGIRKTRLLDAFAHGVASTPERVDLPRTMSAAGRHE
jgi:predicted ATPase